MVLSLHVSAIKIHYKTTNYILVEVPVLSETPDAAQTYLQVRSTCGQYALHHAWAISPLAEIGAVGDLHIIR